MRILSLAASSVLTVSLIAMAPAGPLAAQDEGKSEPKRPRLVLRAQPTIGSVPMRVILSAELVGGDELEEYYCPSVIWRWGRTGSSRSTSDCAPYDPETSTIRRRYTVEHMFRSAGRYRVYFLLSNRGHDLGAAFVDIVVQP